jgi:hypothetical protein
MKRLFLLALLVPAIAVACGGSDGLAEAPTTPAAAPSAESAEPPEPGSSDASAAPQGEEIGEQRSIGGDDEAATDPTEPAADPAEPAADPGAPREEDTSRPVAPVLVGTTLDGEPLSLEDFKGRPIIVKVFADH